MESSDQVQRKLGLTLLAGVGVYGLLTAESVKQRRRELISEEEKKKKEKAIQKVPAGSGRIIDHPLFSWMLTNTSVFTAAYVCLRTKKWLNVNPVESPFKAVMVELGAGILVNEFHMAVGWLLINKVYTHIPFFSKKHVKQSFEDILIDYGYSIIPTVFLAALYEVKLSQLSIATGGSQWKDAFRFRPVSFLGKLFFVKALFDLLFWLGHYLIHLRKLYFIHKKHHEHNRTMLTTNYHFSTSDILIETFIPFAISIAVLEKGLKAKLSKFELLLLSGYIFVFEQQSHAGKALPTMSVLPPVAPLLNKIDDWNVYFHELHHNLLKCNYSISPWWDMLFGTDRWHA